MAPRINHTVYIVHGSKNQPYGIYCSWLQESTIRYILFMAPRINHTVYIVHGSKNQPYGIYCSWLQESTIRYILFMAPRIKMIVTLNLFWSEFAETNERHFDLLLQFLIKTSMIGNFTSICSFIHASPLSPDQIVNNKGIPCNLSRHRRRTSVTARRRRT